LDTATTASLVVLAVFVVLYVMRRKSRLDREAGGKH
jgi:hypothetical protein